LIALIIITIVDNNRQLDLFQKYVIVPFYFIAMVTLTFGVLTLFYRECFYILFYMEKRGYV